ncbi:MAG: hypothetical protein NT027_18945, partial [Proteobacteria bacterium]|nr:hypothetical protein [Pseudomonadota bacterium]
VLAKLYTDKIFRESFISDPETTLSPYNLTYEEIHELKNLDFIGLDLAAHSYAQKLKKRLNNLGPKSL